MRDRPFTEDRIMLSPCAAALAAPSSRLLDALATMLDFLAGVLVVTADANAAAMARRFGTQALTEPAAGGFNDAILMAALRDSDSGMIVVPADVPHISASLIEKLVRRLATPRAIAMMPAAFDGGANGLALRPSDIIAPAFGVVSFEWHRLAAIAAGIAPTIVATSSAGLDIDRPEDIPAFLALRTRTRMDAYLRELGFDHRDVLNVRQPAHGV